MDHERRMELAREVTDYVLRNHRDVLAVILEGSTAKGEDREHSDLELSIVTKSKPDVHYYQCIFEGIVIEAGLATDEETLERAAAVTREWAMAADSWTRSVALYDPGGLLPKLAGLEARPDSGQVREALHNVMTSFYEDLCKTRNFVAAGEDRMARFMAPMMALQAARFLSLLNRQHFNGVRNLLTKPRDFATLPPHFWDDFPELVATEGTSRDVLAHAERLHRECHDLWLGTGEAPPPASTLEEALERGRFSRRDHAGRG